MNKATTVHTEPAVWTVSALTQLLKEKLENSFSTLRLQGEISNCKLQSSGHLYFTLKDAQAQIAAVLFRADAADLDFVPQNGDLVVVEGGLNVYAPGGRYQINIRRMHKQGLGELLLLLEQRKRQVAARGWFRAEHKQKLPLLPRRIGVVTSPTGAAIRDIIQVLTRRAAGFHLILNPVKVQGEGAAEEIAAAINFFNQSLPVDVLLVGRGGGSFEDLWCFNEEIVAAAIFHSRIPVVCAVGHETDHCIAEYVADVRAPTPSAAAEIIMAEQIQLTKQLQRQERELSQAISYRLRLCRQRLNGLQQQPLWQRPRALLEPYMQRLDDLNAGLERSFVYRLDKLKLELHSRRQILAARHPKLQLEPNKQRLASYRQALDHAIAQQLARRQTALQAIQRTLQAIDPQHLLSKGFSILFAEKNGSVITDASALNKGESVHIRLAQGRLQATIEQVFPRE